MIKPAFPQPANPPPALTRSTGEGAETALAAMIRKRKMGENHVEPDAPEPQREAATPDA